VSTIRRSLVLSFAERYSELGLRLLSMVVLARLLTPAEFGTYAVAAAVIGIATVVAEFGLKNYLIQKDELSTGTLRAAFGFALVMGWSVAGLTFAVSEMLAASNLIDPALTELLAILALSMLLQSLQRPFLAILQRQMMFGALLVIGIAKATILAVTVILLAWSGLGALSLAWGSVAQALAGVLVVLGCRRAVPWIWPSLRGWRSILAFGSVSTAITALKQMGDAAPSLAIGHFLGFASAGLFNRAQAAAGVFDKGFLQAISPIVLPMLAARRRDGRDLKPTYEMKIAYLSGIAWPFFVFLALMADPIVDVLLGEQWKPTVPVVRILAVAGLLLPFNQMNLQFFIALDMQSRYLRLQATIQIAKILLVLGSCLLGSLEAVAFAVVGERLLKFALTYRPLKQRLAYDGASLLSALGSSILVTIAAWGAPVAVVLTMGLRPDDSLLALAIAVVGAVCTWFIAIVLCGHPLRAELERGAGRLRVLVQPTS
jgi:O-antigen/teichoic acid export membrane protein